MSTLKADTIQNTSGGAVTLTKQSAAKQWVLYDSVVATTSIDNSFNTSSVTDEGSGDTTIALTSSMSNGLYSMSGICSDYHIADHDAGGADPTASEYRIITFYVTGTDGTRTFSGEDRASTQIFGDLA